MNPIKFAMRRPVTTLMLTVALLVSGGVIGLNEMRADSYPPQKTPKVYVVLDYRWARRPSRTTKGYVVTKVESYFHKHEEQLHEEHRKVLVTSPEAKSVSILQQYVCQIHSQRHINVRALEGGYLEAISVKEGQAVKKGDSMFKIVPILYQAKLDAEAAKRDLAKLKFNYTRTLSEKKVVSTNEVALLGAELAEAQAKANLAAAELNFTDVKAPFDGIIDRLHEQLGSLIKEGDILTTLSDNSVMWVYFNVPEAQYLEYMAIPDHSKENQQIELMLADGNKFKQFGKIGAIEAKFNNETGNIPFRADFPNPDRLLRHGQTGTVVLRRVLDDALVIPQRATFEVLDKRYVYVVGQDDVVHQAAGDRHPEHNGGHLCPQVGTQARRKDHSRGDARDSRRREGGIRVSSPGTGDGNAQEQGGITTASAAGKLTPTRFPPLPGRKPLPHQISAAMTINPTR